MSTRKKSHSPPVQIDGGDYDSSYEGDEEEVKRKKKKHNLVTKDVPKHHQGLVTREVFTEQYSQEARRSMQSKLRGLTAYDRHKLLINEYYMSYPGASANIPRRDPTRDKRDIDVIKENHQFLWEEDDVVDTWGKQLAKKYHDKLFKEYCICDLSRYKENKVGLRWRIEKEVVSGKGQFNCGEQKCNEMDHLRTWEVNFAYMEHGFKKSSLVKIRLCGECSRRLNYHHQKKEVTKKKKKKSKKTKKDRGDKHRESPEEDQPSTSTTTSTEAAESSKTEEPSSSSTDVWKESQQTAEEKSRDEEFEEYLEDLFL